MNASDNPLLDPRDLRMPRVADPCVLVMFGITGDLARHKLLPAIYDLANRGLLSPAFSLVGVGRRDWDDEAMRAYVREAVEAHARTGSSWVLWRVGYAVAGAAAVVVVWLRW